MPNQETNVRTLKINRLTDAQYDAAIKNDAELYLTPGDDTLSRNIGETVFSLIPLTDAGLHLLDGSLISNNGIYSAFYNYMLNLYGDGTNPPNYFTDETSWQNSVTTYGVCGKFVIDTTNQTVRLPKITGIVEGTLDSNALGDLVEAGLPDHKHNTVINNDMTTSGATYDKLIPGQSGASRGTATFLSTNVVDNPIYGNSTTVQPQTIKGYYYIVLATTVKTNIQVDIDEIATEINNLSTAYIVETYSSGTDWYRIWSDGWCEQGGLASAISSGDNTLVNLLKPYINTNYSLVITSNSAYYAQAEANSTALKESENQIRITNGSHITSDYTWCTYGYIS